jgi:heme-degrading monooxygenase HmoA
MTFAALPKPPYYAVIFTARRAEGDHGYGETADRMEALARTMPGYLGFESARNEDGFGIAISYWESEDAIANWKQNAEHLEAQSTGRAKWYEDYKLCIAKVERAYEMKK